MSESPPLEITRLVDLGSISPSIEDIASTGLNVETVRAGVVRLTGNPEEVHRARAAIIDQVN